MAKNEEGEFELILGNRQLISVFVIVVILLGVFFSMGYIVGRNSAPTTTETAREVKPPATWPQSSDTAAKTPEPAPAPATTPAATPATTPEPPPTASAPTSTHPVKEEPPPPAPAPAPKAPIEKPKAIAPVTATASLTGEPSAGDYWQVVATARPDAEIITEALSKKGFHAIMAPAPKEGAFRVLVGPLKDAANQAQTRSALEAAGFKNPIKRKY